jgi:hypothetical protein
MKNDDQPMKKVALIGQRVSLTMGKVQWDPSTKNPPMLDSDT